MDNSEVYNLEKLKWVFCGMVIPMFVGVVCNLFSDAMIAVIINFVIQTAGFTIVVIGLKEISKYSYRFQKAYHYAILGLIIVIALMIGIFISVISSIFATLMLFIAIIVAFTLIGISIYFYYSILKGIEEVARGLGEETFATKIADFWYTYIWTQVIVVVVYIIGSIAFSEFAPIILIPCLVVNFMLYMYIYKAYKLLNGREIPKCMPSDEVLINDSVASDNGTQEDKTSAREE